MNGVRGASEESINSLPTHKFKVRRDQCSSNGDSPAVEEGGLLAAGTEKERAISGEDAVSLDCDFKTPKTFPKLLIQQNLVVS